MRTTEDIVYDRHQPAMLRGYHLMQCFSSRTTEVRSAPVVCEASIKQPADRNLDEGKPKHWPVSLKNTIIDNFINTDKQVRKIVSSRRSLWKNLKRFFQWLLWLFGMY